MSIFGYESAIAGSLRPHCLRFLLVGAALWLTSLAQAANAAVILPTGVTDSDLLAPATMGGGSTSESDPADESDSVPVPDLSALAPSSPVGAGTGAGPSTTSFTSNSVATIALPVCHFALDDLLVSLIGERAIHLPSPSPSGILRPPRV